MPHSASHKRQGRTMSRVRSHSKRTIECSWHHLAHPHHITLRGCCKVVTGGGADVRVCAVVELARAASSITPTVHWQLLVESPRNAHTCCARHAVAVPHAQTTPRGLLLCGQATAAKSAPPC